MRPDISNLDAYLGDGPLRALFEKLYWCEATTGTCQLPPRGRIVAHERFGSAEAVETQLVLRVQNRVTGEAALFNRLRSARPSTRVEQDILAALGRRPEPAECLFCKENFDEVTAREHYPRSAGAGEGYGEPETIAKRAAAPGGERIRGLRCTTTSNVAKYEGRHGVIVFDEHDPLAFSEEEVVDSFSVARAWFLRMRDAGAYFPFLMWNCRWRGGASMEHGHLQVTMASRRHYPKVERLWEAASRYGGGEARTYFENLFHIHRSLGLGFEVRSPTESCGSVRVMAHLTPFREKEVLVCSDLAFSASEEHAGPATARFASAVHGVLDALRGSLRVESFNLGVLIPPLSDDPAHQWPGFPTVCRIIDRLSVGELPSDISGMGIFAGADAIASDPYEVIEAIARRFDANEKGSSVLSGLRATWRELVPPATGSATQACASQ
ncbi:hypothetical protein ACFL59_07170 [Planctomycetota bacterium]